MDAGQNTNEVEATQNNQPQAPVETPQVERQVTSAEEFRKLRLSREEAKLVELPSGLVAELRRPSVDKLIRSGHIPTDVAVSVQRMQGSNTSTLKGDDLAKYFELVDLMALNSFVNPKVKKGECTDEEYAQGIISLDDLEENDKVFAMQYVQTGLTDLTKFRQELQL